MSVPDFIDNYVKGNPETQRQYQEWLSTKDLSKYTGAISGRFTYIITPHG